MRWNTPLSEDHAALLVQRLALPEAGSVLDLGCGWGELMLRCLAEDAGGALTGVGVDISKALLERGRELAAARGLEDRVTFVDEPAQTYTGTADRVLCIGASQAWDGAPAALEGLAGAVRPGGRLLFGDGCWERSPTAAARSIFGDGVPMLPELASHATRAGWRVLHLSTADQREWDDFESTWRAGRELWLAEHGAAPDTAPLRAELEDRLMEYVTVYRGLLGFAYLVLRRA
jgi:cyclopropane fatty-acyl-phospholipid synthase-like methyltransferase